MKFVAAFFFLGLFSTLAYMVWTNEFPYHLIPTDEFDPGRVDRIQGMVNGLIAHFGPVKTGWGLLIAGLVSSLYFVSGSKEEDVPY